MFYNFNNFVMCNSPLRILIMSLSAFIIMYAYLLTSQYFFAIFMGILGLGLFIFWIKKRDAIKCIVDAFWERFVSLKKEEGDSNSKT